MRLLNIYLNALKLYKKDKRKLKTIETMSENTDTGWNCKLI